MHQLANLVSNGACGGGRVEAVTSLVELAIQGRPLGLHAFLVESAIMGLAIHPVHTEITPFPRSVFFGHLSDEGSKHYQTLRILYRIVVGHRKPRSNIWASVCEATV